MKRPSRRLKTRLLTIGMIVIFGMAALSPLSPEAEEFGKNFNWI